MVRAGDGCVLAFDFGTRHIGVAVGQTISNTASPLTTLRASNGKPDWREVSALIEAWQPLLLIVGLPLNMDGSEGFMAGQARAFAGRIAELGVAVDGAQDVQGGAGHGRGKVSLPGGSAKLRRPCNPVAAAFMPRL